MESLYPQLPALVVLFPFVGALIAALVGWSHRDRVYGFAVVILGLTVFSAVGCLCSVLHGNGMTYRLGGWPPPFGIEYKVDGMNALVLVVISASAFLTTLFSRDIVERELRTRKEHFYTLLLLLISGLLGITITNDAFNLYVLVEISALTSYALIAMSRGRAVFAAFQYVMIGTIGACFYLIGVGYLYIQTGTLNMTDLQGLIATMQDSRAIKAALIFILVGTWIKMGLFPSHGWLPNAYSEASE